MSKIFSCVKDFTVKILKNNREREQKLTKKRIFLSQSDARSLAHAIQWLRKTNKCFQNDKIVEKRDWSRLIMAINDVTHYYYCYAVNLVKIKIKEKKRSLEHKKKCSMLRTRTVYTSVRYLSHLECVCFMIEIFSLFFSFVIFACQIEVIHALNGFIF